MPTRVEVRSAPLLSGLDEAVVAASHWEELSACGACGQSAAVRDVIEVSGTDESGTSVAVCDDCEHAFLRRRPTQAWFDDYYAAEWDVRGRSSGVKDTPVARKVASFCAPHLREAARVLDVGAGFGSQLLGFRELGHEPFGLERSEHRAAHVESLGIPCAFGPFERAELPTDLDLVFSHHVLEHTGDPETVLRRCAAAVKPDGLVYVAVPNLWHEHPAQTAHFVPHLSTFTERSLETLLARCGLAVIARRVDRELQLLARRQESATPAPTTRDPDFAARVEEWSLAGFGAGAGAHLLVWWKSPTPATVYARDTRPARAARWLELGEAIESRMPRAGRSWRRRLWPAVASRTARSLLVEVLDGEAPRLPILVRHPQASPPVWVK